MKSLLALPVIALLGLGATACGGADRAAHMPAGRYLNDGDAEKIDDHDPDNRSSNHEDGDGDSFKEYEDTYDNGSYRDSDDHSTLILGHAASAADRRAITAVVKRYYAAAAAGDGAEACSMLTPSLARAAPEDYGKRAGPVYLRGSRNCPAIMSRLFKHFHAELTGAIEVTGVRVDSESTLALVGSSTIPAGEVAVKREGGAWRLTSLLAHALP
jgi:hypothetical protein